MNYHTTMTNLQVSLLKITIKAPSIVDFAFKEK
jgi:hypothetical protein